MRTTPHGAERSHIWDLTKDSLAKDKSRSRQWTSEDQAAGSFYWQLLAVAE